MKRSSIQFFYEHGPRIKIESPLTKENFETKLNGARDSGDLLVLESLPENPRETDTTAIVYLNVSEGIAFISFMPVKEQSLVIEK